MSCICFDELLERLPALQEPTPVLYSSARQRMGLGREKVGKADRAPAPSTPRWPATSSPLLESVAYEEFSERDRRSVS